MKAKFKKLLFLFFHFLFAIACYVGISAIFAAFDCGTSRELLQQDKTTAPSYALQSLIAYRFCIYLIPAVLLFLFKRVVQKKDFKKSIVSAFNTQFISYAIIAAVWKMCGQDFYWGVVLFEAMDSFVLLVGLALTLSLNISFAKFFEESEENKEK